MATGEGWTQGQQQGIRGVLGAASGHSFASLVWALSTATAALKFPAVMALRFRPPLRFRNGLGPSTLNGERSQHCAANIWNEIQTYRL